MPPMAEAGYRYFVSADGMQRIHKFVQGERRTLTAERLERQLAGAEYAPTGQPAPVISHPTRRETGK